jgi:hypothetical protein
VPVCCNAARCLKTQNGKYPQAISSLNTFCHLKTALAAVFLFVSLSSCGNETIQFSAKSKAKVSKTDSSEYSFELQTLYEDSPLQNRGVFDRQVESLSKGFTSFSEDIQRPKFGANIFFAASKYLGFGNWMLGKPAKKELFFANFTDGFLMARLEAQGPFYQENQKGLVYSHAAFRSAKKLVNLRENGLDFANKVTKYSNSSQLEVLIPYYGGFLCALQNFGKMQAPKWMNCHSDVVPVENGKCQAVGEHSKGNAEVFSHQNGNSCFFQVRPQNPEKPDSFFESELVCLSPKQKLLKTPLWDRAQFVFPSVHKNSPQGKSVFFVYEGNYQSAKVHKLNLESFDFTTDSSPTLFDTKKKFRSALSNNRLFLYGCEVPNSNVKRHYVIVNADIAYGQKKLKENQEAVWQVIEPKGAGLGAEMENEDLTVVQSNWQQLRMALPALDDLPDGDCAKNTVVDLKCGIRVMKSLLQIHWEMFQPSIQKNPSVLGALMKSFRKTQAQLVTFRAKLESQMLSAFDLDSSKSYLLRKSQWALNDFSQDLLKLKNADQLDNEAQWQTQIATLRIAHQMLAKNYPDWAEYFPFQSYSQK